MSPRSFQEVLRSKHIIIADYNLPRVSCDRHGLLSLNSLKEVVNIEGIKNLNFLKNKGRDALLIDQQDQSTSDTPQLKAGILKHFVDNLELENPNTLRIIRMRTYSGAESFPFSSDHAAWRDTASDPYCTHKSTEEPSLRWTDISTTNTVQFWRIAPAGFGIFFDIRSGRQLVIIVKPEHSNEDGSEDFFTRWDHYLQDFDRLSPTFCSKNRLEAIRLDPGNRL